MYVCNGSEEHLRILLADPEVPTVMLWGPPGVGKSSIVRQIAAESGWGFLDLRLLLLNPIDLRGIPYPNRKPGKRTGLPLPSCPMSGATAQQGSSFMMNSPPPHGPCRLPPTS